MLDIEPDEFIQLPLIERATLMLREECVDPPDSISPINVAGNLVARIEQFPLVAGRPAGPDRREVEHAVSEAWQVLEQVRCVCQDFSQRGTYFSRLTAKGMTIRDSSDPEDEIRAALGGTL